MIKSSAILTEAIRKPKHLFSKADGLPKKARKHRYERRKVRAYLHLANWVAGEAASA